jgi:hypothetical protein
MKTIKEYEVLTANLINNDFGLSSGFAVKLRYSGIKQVEVLSTTPFNYLFGMANVEDVKNLFTNLKFSHIDRFETL